MSRDEFWYWFGVWTSILMLAAAGGVICFSDFFSPEMAAKVGKACLGFAAINHVILTAAKRRGYLDSKAGIGIGAETVAKILLVAFAASFLLAGTSGRAEAAAAKTCAIPFDPLKLCGALTGKPAEDIQRVAKRIAKIATADLNYAMAMAEAAKTPSSAVRLQCLLAISAANASANGSGLKNADGSPMKFPDPALATAVEGIAELIDNLSPQGVLFTSCAGAAQMLATDTLTAVNGIVTGAVGLATATAAHI
jgi:hypothetical protein